VVQITLDDEGLNDHMTIEYDVQNIILLSSHTPISTMVRLPSFRYSLQETLGFATEQAVLVTWYAWTT